MDKNLNQDPEENMIEEDSLVILKDEDGNDVRFEFLDFIEYENENYVVLLPADEVDGDEADEVVILKEDKDAEEDDEESYISVDDEEVLNKVFEIFKEKFKDDYNFIEDQ